MSRIGALLALLLACSALGQAPGAGERGILWEIRAQGEVAGYLLGTMHHDDPRLLRLPEPVRQALLASRRLGVEVVMDDAALATVQRRIRLPPGESLAASLPAKTWQRLRSAMRSRGVTEQQLQGLRPWAVAMSLSLPRRSGGPVLDEYLQQLAGERGLAVFSLETIEEQLAVFEDLAPDEQVYLLQLTLDQLPDMPRLTARLTEAYLARDLAAISALVEEGPVADAAFEQRLQRRLIDQRNRRMLPRLREQLAAGGVFFAVGALHLPGDQGLISLLRRAGYALSARY